MFCGKRDDLEAASRSGVFYSIWINAEDIHGSYFETTDFENGAIGDAYDELEEAIEAIWDNFRDNGAIERYVAEQEAQGYDDIDFIEVLIERNELDKGIDCCYDAPTYSLFFHPQTGEWREHRH